MDPSQTPLDPAQSAAVANAVQVLFAAVLGVVAGYFIGLSDNSNRKP